MAKTGAWLFLTAVTLALLVSGDARAQNQYKVFQQMVYGKWNPPPGTAKVVGEVAIDQYGLVRNVRFVGVVSPQVQQTLYAAITQSAPLMMYSQDAAESLDGIVRVGFEFDPTLARGRAVAAAGTTGSPKVLGTSNRARAGASGVTQAQLSGGSSSSADANAVQLCVAQIQAAGGCGSVVQITRVNQVDRRITESEATVIADVDFRVLTNFAGSSGAALNCTGTSWDMDPAKVQSQQETLPFGMPLPSSENRFLVGQGLRVRKSFTFQKFESGWRCVNKAMSPVDAGYYLSNN